MKGKNGQIKCDICADDTASHVAINQHAPLISDPPEEGGFGFGRIVVLLCVGCASGVVGAAILALGNVILKLVY